MPAIKHVCKLCGEEFDDELQLNFHEANERHCPTCGEVVKYSLTAECKLCLVEKFDKRENDSVYWH